MSGYPRCEPYKDWKNEKKRLKQIADNEREEVEARARSDRYNERHNGLWNVPAHARDAFMEMANSIGEDAAEKILAFVEAMKEV